MEFVLHLLRAACFMAVLILCHTSAVLSTLEEMFFFNFCVAGWVAAKSGGSQNDLPLRPALATLMQAVSQCQPGLSEFACSSSPAPSVVVQPEQIQLITCPSRCFFQLLCGWRGGGKEQGAQNDFPLRPALATLMEAVLQSQPGISEFVCSSSPAPSVVAQSAQIQLSTCPSRFFSLRLWLEAWRPRARGPK